MNAMQATVLTNLAICGVIVGALIITTNPLALAGLMLLRAIPVDSELMDAIGAGEAEEDHVRREVGFNAKYDIETEK